MKFALYLAILMLAAGPASADPVTLLGSLLTTGATALFGGSAALIGGSFLVHFAVTAGIGFLKSQLAGGSQKQQTDSGYVASNGRGGALPHAIIYGETVVGGPIVYEEVTNNSAYFMRVIVLAGHECDSISRVYFDDISLTLDASGLITAPAKYVGLAKITMHLGDQTTADSMLVNNSDGSWSSSHVGNEICYMVIRFNNSRKDFPAGFPTVTAKVKGRKVYDPRTGTTAWSDNAALCARDYFTAAFGLGVPASRINDSEYKTSAGICDEVVSLAAGGTEKRYTCNGSFTTGTNHRTTITALHSAMAGYPSYSQGVWSSIPGAYNAATKSLTVSDLRGPISLSPRHPRAANFNSVAGEFRGAETDWIPTEYPAVTSATFTAEDNGVSNPASLDLNFTDTSTAAQRIAKIMLYRNREQLTFTAAFGLGAFGVAVGEIIQFTYAKWGWSAKEFEVVGWNFNPGANALPTIELTLTEISSGVFDWNADESVFTNNNTNLVDPYSVPVLGLTTSMRVQVLAEKISFVLTAVTTTSAAGYVDSVDIEYKLSTSSTWLIAGSGDVGSFEIPDLQNTSYDVRARARNIFGTPGAWTTNSGVTPTTSAVPEDVGNFGASVAGSSISMQWDAATDSDLSYYIIRHALEETGATWANATTAVEKVPRPATSFSVPARPGTYMIRSVSKFGVLSANYSTAVVPETDLEDFGTTATQSEATTFSGTKTDCSVTASELRIDYPSEADGVLVYSEQLDTWPNVYSFVTGTTDDAVAPDGTTTAELITPSGTGVTAHFTRQTNTPIVIGQNVYHNFSVFVKPSTGQYYRIRAFHAGGTGGADDEATFDVINGTVITEGVQTNVDARIDDAGNGWWRLSVSVLNPVDTDTQFNTYCMDGPADDDQVFDAAVSTPSFWVWGLQVTKGRYLRAYHKTTANTLNNEATYDFSNYIDTSAVRRVRARIDVNTNRVDNSSGLFDNLTGNFDNLPGMFDDLTGSAEFSDTDVVSYISTTDDDPAGTPTWSSYRLFQAGDFSGRAFRFRVVLKTSAHDVTPSISALVARVQY